MGRVEGLLLVHTQLRVLLTIGVCVVCVCVCVCFVCVCVAAVQELRELVEKHRTRLRLLDEEGVSRQMLTAATQYRMKGTRNLMQRAIDEMTGQFNQLLALKTDVSTTAKLERSKVDWEKLRETILQLTRRFIHEYVEAETDRLKQDVKADIERVFNVDPSLRADMESVRFVWCLARSQCGHTSISSTLWFCVLPIGQVSRLSEECKAAIAESQRVTTILDEGVAGMIAKAQAAMNDYADGLLGEFRKEAEAIQQTTLSALANCEERLEAKINVRYADGRCPLFLVCAPVECSDFHRGAHALGVVVGSTQEGLDELRKDAARVQENLEATVEKRVAELEERVVARFEEVIADLKASMDKCMVRTMPNSSRGCGTVAGGTTVSPHFTLACGTQEMCNRCVREVDTLKAEVKAMTTRVRALERGVRRPVE